MKKKFTPLALALLLVCLAGCAKIPAEKPQLQETMPASGPVQSAPAPAQPTAPAEAQQPDNTLDTSTETTTETTAPTEVPSGGAAPTEPASTTPAPTTPATAPTEQKPVTPPTIPPTEPKPTESIKPTEPKPTEPKPTEPKPTVPTTQPTEPPTEVPTQPAAGVTEADFPALEEYARNYASSLGFKVDRSLGYGNAGYYPAVFISSKSLEDAKANVRGGVSSLKGQLLSCDDTTAEMFDGQTIRYNCHLFYDSFGNIMQDDFYG